MILIGFIVSVVSMGIYGTSGDAMMHCFLLDEELNERIPQHTPDKLRDFMKDNRD